MVTFLVRFGMDEDRVLDDDLISFKARHASALRVFYQQKTEDAWTAMLAAQGTDKDMKERVKTWKQITDAPSERKPATAKDLKGFFARMSNPNSSNGKAARPSHQGKRK